MVKIFIGNLPREATSEEIQSLFSQYGEVTECAIIKNYGFVHMKDRKSANEAIRNLHLYKLHGTAVNVEASRNKSQGATKLHVANIDKSCTSQDLRALFEDYGTVTECDIVKNYAFVHMANSDEAMDAIKALDNSEFQGKRIHVQLSTSRQRTEEDDGYYQGGPPGREGFWPPKWPGERPNHGPPGFYGPGRFNHPPPYPHPPPPPPPPRPRPAMYMERSSYDDRNRAGVVDYYEKYRARPYGITSYEERRMAPLPPPPPPPPSMMRDRLSTSALDPYERRPLPPPPASASFYPRDRSPIRRPPPVPAPPVGNGYAYERTRLSPVSSLSRGSMYDMSRPREPFAERPSRFSY
ncbi:RNA-binding protein 4.3 isoform X1 [Erpetoichthys calabaricus]|uniref:RNA binding motif protein 4.3 n=1 Tax=Erpetoichthys calabaricus TaxID=27687 RepID=A0A8C4X3F4_ERPCA|nr:RNA-binding protein 4.3 isoform X1 [Erpetoichthys calabaricus]XP_028659045.1 RNA-binding protein 4.3 isoform X1 [Erpetoichthys calabaricus]